MFNHEIKIRVLHLNKTKIVTMSSLKDRQSPPTFTIKKLKRLYLGELPFSISRKNVVIGHASTLNGAISSVKEHVLYSDWSDELPVH